MLILFCFKQDSYIKHRIITSIWNIIITLNGILHKTVLKWFFVLDKHAISEVSVI